VGLRILLVKNTQKGFVAKITHSKNYMEVSE